MNIFIAGSNSSMGRSLINILRLSKKNNIFTASRENNSKSSEKHFQIKDCFDLSFSKHCLPKKVDIFFNLIGTEIPIGSAIDTSYSEFENAFKVNVYSTIALTSALKDALGKDSVSFIFSSRLSKYPEKFSSIYCSSKAALNMIIQCMNKELDLGRFFAVIPPPFYSKMQERLVKDMTLGNYYADLKKVCPDLLAKKLLSILDDMPSDPFDCLNLSISDQKHKINHDWISL